MTELRCRAVTEAGYFPRDCWLWLLAEGWRFPGDIATEMRGSHGHWSVCLVRELEKPEPSEVPHVVAR